MITPPKFDAPVPPIPVSCHSKTPRVTWPERTASTPPQTDGPNSRSTGAIHDFLLRQGCFRLRLAVKKEAKLAVKTAIVTASTNAGERGVKAEKEKRQAEVALVNTTPPGVKKASSIPCGGYDVELIPSILDLTQPWQTAATQWPSSQLVRLVTGSRLLQALGASRLETETRKSPLRTFRRRKFVYQTCSHRCDPGWGFVSPLVGHAAHLNKVPGLNRT